MPVKLVQGYGITCKVLENTEQINPEFLNVYCSLHCMTSLHRAVYLAYIFGDANLLCSIRGYS